MEKYENGIEQKDAQSHKYVGEVEGFSTFDAFMNRVYALMGGGLFISFLTALGVAFYIPEAAISGWLIIAAFVVELILVFSITASIADPAKAKGTIVKYFVYSIVTGFTFSIIFLTYSPTAILSALLSTTVVFVAMSFIGTVTKKNLQGAMKYLFMGIIGIIVAWLINMFLWNNTFTLIISIVTVIIFTILVAVDTQKLAILYNQVPVEEQQNMAVYGALTLYLDFINIFLSILDIFSAASSE